MSALEDDVENEIDHEAGGEQLPPGRVAVVDDTSGKTFYHNESTDETSWEVPTGRMEVVEEGDVEEEEEEEMEKAVMEVKEVRARGGPHAKRIANVI